MLRPGVAEREVAQRVHQEIERAGLETAWDRNYDPVVNFGAASPFGHAGPSDTPLEPGMLVHVDLGVKMDGYCSDLQRMWYLTRPDEEQPPAEVLRPFRTVVESMQAGFKALRPGVPGWQVDAAARGVITGAGYPEPEFALGHQLGQSTHDGGSLLGPRWPRYGDRPNMQVEAGNVFTLEYAVRSPAGTIGLEEDVLVTEAGAEYLSTPQTELVYLPG
jgi:Xaa-Pro aminopeptidase